MPVVVGQSSSSLCNCELLSTFLISLITMFRLFVVFCRSSLVLLSPICASISLNHGVSFSFATVATSHASVPLVPSVTSAYSLIFWISISFSILFQLASSYRVSFAVLSFEHMMCLSCFLSRISFCVVVFSVSSLLPTALPYRNTAFIVALVILSFVFTAKYGSLLKILVSAKDADFAFCNLLRKWTLYLSCFFASPR